jgi:hypothetical protein
LKSLRVIEVEEVKFDTSILAVWEEILEQDNRKGTLCRDENYSAANIFLGFKPDTARKLAVGTGIVTKGVTLLRSGELTLDFQFDVGRGVKFETNLNLGVNPKDLTDVRKAEVHFGLVRRF